jgi:antitoxin HigA-1
MPAYKATRDPNRPPVHPGEILREDVLRALNMPVQTAAKPLGVTRQTLHRILAGRWRRRPPWRCASGSFAATAPIFG